METRYTPESRTSKEHVLFLFVFVAVFFQTSLIISFSRTKLKSILVTSEKVLTVAVI